MPSSPKIPRYQLVVCADNFSISVQASEYAYCSPRNNTGPYKDVELGYPSQPDDLIAKWAEDKTRPTETIYGWVAVDVVRDLIAKHGGAVRGTVPPGVVMLMAPEAERKEGEE